MRLSGSFTTRGASVATGAAGSPKNVRIVGRMPPLAAAARACGAMHACAIASVMRRGAIRFGARQPRERSGQPEHGDSIR
jgi:hypothetical protein